MNRDRVVRLRIDPGVVQEFQQRIALTGLLRLDDEEMKDVPVADQFNRQIKVAASLQPGAVTGGPLPPQVVPRVDVLELGAEHAGMQIIQTAVETVAVNVARVRAVIAQLANAGVDLGVVRDEGAAVAEGAEVFLDDKTDRRRVAQFAHLEAVAVRSDPLGIVFDEAEFVFGSNLLDGEHVGALTVQVHRDNGPGLRRNGRFDLCRVDALGPRIAIDEDGRGAGGPDRLGGGEERVRVGDDFVAGADAQGHQRKPDGIGAVADADGVFHAVVARQFLLEPLEHRPHDILAAQEHLLEVGVNLLLDVAILADVAVELDFHRKTFN